MVYFRKTFFFFVKRFNEKKKRVFLSIYQPSEFVYHAKFKPIISIWLFYLNFKNIIGLKSVQDELLKNIRLGVLRKVIYSIV